MVRIRTDDIFITDGDKIIFGDDFDSELFWDDYAGDLRLTTTISGVDPTEDHHIATKNYDDTHLRGQPISSTAAANGQIVVWSGSLWELGDHGDLAGLDNDDHAQYSLIDGTRAFTSTVGGVEPIEDAHLITKKYLFDVLSGQASGTGSGTGFNTLFGSEFQFIQDNTTSQTTSTTYQEKINISISGATGSGIPYGDYRIGFSYEWRQSKLNHEFWARVRVDDTLTIFEREISPFVDVDFWNITTSFYYYPALSSGIHTIDMDYKTSNASSVSYIKNAKIEFWRVI